MKNWKKLTAAALVALALVGALAGCGNNADKKPDTKQATKIVTDLKGREVSVPQDVKRIAVVPIPWASVIYAIDGSSERLAAIHGGAMSAYKGKFLETKDKHFAQLDTKIIAQNFSVNIESAAQAGIDTAILWQYQDKDAEKLTKVGIPTLLIYNDTVENLKKSFLIIGKLLGKEERAAKINEYYEKFIKQEEKSILLRKKLGKRPISQLFCSCVMLNCACRVMITSCMRLFVLAVEKTPMNRLL